MKTITRVLLTLGVLGGALAIVDVGRALVAPAEARIAVTQVQDSAATYGITTAFLRSDALSTIVWCLASAALSLLWGRAIATFIRTGALPLAALMLTGCFGPAKVLPLEMVGPNETAFVIPLEGDTVAQEKFESVEFLNKHKVVTKRIEIPVRERSIGRQPNGLSR